MDAEPEIERTAPDIYVVNEDGDKPEKRAFCAEHGLEYVVLKRTPKDGLSKRSSTDLRGFCANRYPGSIAPRFNAYPDGHVCTPALRYVFPWLEEARRVPTASRRACARESLTNRPHG